MDEPVPNSQYFVNLVNMTYFPLADVFLVPMLDKLMENSPIFYLLQ